MATFIVKLRDKNVTGRTKSDSQGNFESVAQCPSCSSKFSSVKKKDQARTVVDLESCVKAGLKRHYDKKHKGN